MKKLKVFYKIIFIILSTSIILAIAKSNVFADWQDYESKSLGTDVVEFMELKNSLLNQDISKLSEEEKKLYVIVYNKWVDQSNKDEFKNSYTPDEMERLQKNAGSLATNVEEEPKLPVDENQNGIKYGTEGVGPYALTWQEIVKNTNDNTSDGFGTWDGAIKQAQLMESYILTDISTIKENEWNDFLNGFDMMIDKCSALKADKQYDELWERVRKKIEEVNNNNNSGMTEEQKTKAKELLEKGKKAEEDAKKNTELDEKDKKDKDWSISGTVIMGNNKGTSGGDVADVRDDLENYKPSGEIEDAERLQEIGEIIISALRIVGIVVAIITLSLLGFKYMAGGTAEKAEYKKTMIPFLIGAGILLIGTQLVGILYEIISNNIK